MKKPFKTTEERIVTPEDAKKMLEKISKIRANYRKVQTLYNGRAVVLSSRGYLLSGRSQLESIIKSGKPQELFICQR